MLERALYNASDCIEVHEVKIRALRLGRKIRYRVMNKLRIMAKIFPTPLDSSLF